MLLVPSATGSAHSVHPTYPPQYLFSGLFNNAPALSPPIADHTLAHPFTISPDVYNTMLHVGWPITIALVYATSVRYVNQVNKERNYRPWAFSKTLTFYVLVVTHNIFLALYSGWTFIGMWTAIRHSWPGWNGEYGIAGAADALCKINGPRGPGSAATYNTTAGSWSISDITMKLTGGSPDSTDVGRIWNEGLAFYGWIFYLSKFYEVLDTAIILLKGKKSSLLQTYHHAGVMFCMWAGIRYMSPPIWMFTFINSGLHTLMASYTYYTLSALTVQVPQTLKRTLTFLQITQIIFGSSYALAHLFVAYDVPHYASYRVLDSLSTAIPSAASSASTAIASAAASADIGSWMKKAALRAAGEEGLAENVRNYNGETFGIDAIHAADAQRAQEYVSYHLEMTRTHCLDNSGEVFAIVLNVIYLAPLAYLFIKFFARYFQARADGDPREPSIPMNAVKSASEGIKEVERKIAQAMEDGQGGKTEPPPQLKAELDEAHDRARKALSDAQQKSKDVSEKMQSDLKDLRAKVQQGATDAKDKVKDNTPHIPAKAQERAQELGTKVKETAQKVGGDAKDSAQAVQNIVKQKSAEVKDKASKGSKPAANGPKEDSQVQAARPDRDAEGDKKPDSAKKENKPDKEETKDNKNNDEAGDASAYEVNSDLPKTDAEKKAQGEMQPKGK